MRYALFAVLLLLFLVGATRSDAQSVDSTDFTAMLYPNPFVGKTLGQIRSIFRDTLPASSRGRLFYKSTAPDGSELIAEMDYYGSLFGYETTLYLSLSECQDCERGRFEITTGSIPVKSTYTRILDSLVRCLGRAEEWESPTRLRALWKRKKFGYLLQLEAGEVKLFFGKIK